MSAYKYFNHAFRVGDLRATYKKYIQETTAVGLDKIGRDQFREEYEDHVDIINRKANNDTYSFTPYKKKLISKGENKYPRVISIPTFRDRITLRSLCNVLSSTFNHDLSLEIPQVKIQSINSSIKNNQFDSYIKIDITNFYPSINHEILFKALRKRTRKPQIINLIKKAITNKTVNKSGKEKTEDNTVGIPQGLSISNVLAEIYILSIDEKYIHRKDIFYTRYVDDILIFCSKKDINSIFSSLKNELDSISLDVHPLNEKNSKCQSGEIHDEIHFLGYKYKNRNSTIISTNRQKFENSIANLLTTFKYNYNKATNDITRRNITAVLEWRLNLKITGCVFDNRKRGWMFYFSQIDDINILFSMDNTIDKLTKKFGLSDLNIKKLTKTYHESQRVDTDSHKYITNFDLLTAAQKKEILERYLGIDTLQHATDETIERYFKMRITHIIKEMEQDIGKIS